VNEERMTRKRQSLEEHKQKRHEEAQAQSNIYGSLFVLGIIIVAALAVFFYLNRDEPLPPISSNLDISTIADNSVGFESQGNNHLPTGAERDPYNSNPPTSGAHNERWVTPLQTYNQQLPDDMLIHNLEHGHIWLSYRDANDSDAIAVLSALQRQYPGRVVVTLRPENPTRVVAAAWTRLLTLDELDAEQLEAFIIRHNDNAPESIMGR
jgi:hypothetical protein